MGQSTEVVVDANTSSQIAGQILDAAGVGFGSLDTFKVTAYERRTGQIVTGWDKKDEIANVDGSGNYTIPLPPIVQTPLRPSRKREYRVLLLEWTFNGAVDRGTEEWTYPIDQAAVTTPPSP